MEKRRFKRKPTRLKAEFVSGGVRYAGYIENISEEGLFMTTDPTKTAIDFTPAIPRRLMFQLPDGEKIQVKCDVRWFYTKTSPRGLIFTMGIRIIKPPKEFKKALKDIK
jgi:hypothetical protein